MLQPLLLLKVVPDKAVFTLGSSPNNNIILHHTSQAVEDGCYIGLYHSEIWLNSRDGSFELVNQSTTAFTILPCLGKTSQLIPAHSFIYLIAGKYEISLGDGLDFVIETWVPDDTGELCRSPLEPRAEGKKIVTSSAKSGTISAQKVSSANGKKKEKTKVSNTMSVSNPARRIDPWPTPPAEYHKGYNNDARTDAPVEVPSEIPAPAIMPELTLPTNSPMPAPSASTSKQIVNSDPTKHHSLTLSQPRNTKTKSGKDIHRIIGLTAISKVVHILRKSPAIQNVAQKTLLEISRGSVKAFRAEASILRKLNHVRF